MEQSIGEPPLEQLRPQAPHEAYLTFKSVVSATENQLGTRILSAFKIDTVEAHRKEIDSTTLKKLNDEMAKAHRKQSPTEAGGQAYESDLPLSLLPEAILLSESDAKRKFFIPNPPSDHDYPFQVIEVSGSGVESLPEILTESEIEKVCDTYDKLPITEPASRTAITSFVKRMKKISGPDREALERSILEKIQGTAEIPTLASNLRTSLRSMIDTANNIPLPEEIRQLNKVLPVPIEYTPKDIIEKRIDSETVTYYSPSSGTLQIREHDGEPRDATDLDWIHYAEQVSVGFVESIPTWMKQLLESGQLKEGKTYIPWQHSGPHIFQRQILEQLNGLANIVAPQLEMEIKRGIEIKQGAGNFVVNSEGVTERQDTYERTHTTMRKKDETIYLDGEPVQKVTVSVPEYPLPEDVLAVADAIAKSKHPQGIQEKLQEFSTVLKDAAIVMTHTDRLREGYFAPFAEELYQLAGTIEGQEATTISTSEIASMQQEESKDRLALLFLYGKPFNTLALAIPLNADCIQTQRSETITSEYAGVMNAAKANSDLLGGKYSVSPTDLLPKTEEALLSPEQGYLGGLAASWGYRAKTSV